MRLVWAMGIAALFGGVQEWGKRASDYEAKVATESSWTFSDGEKVEVLGVCRWADSTFECWDGKGEPSTAATEALLNSLKSSYGFQYNVKPGAKSRVFLVQSSRSEGRPNEGREIVQIGDTSVGGVSHWYRRNLKQGYEQLKVYMATFSPETKTTSLYLRFPEIASAPQKVHWKPGETFEIEGLKLTMAAFEKKEMPRVNRRRGSAEPPTVYAWVADCAVIQQPRFPLSVEGQLGDRIGSHFHFGGIDKHNRLSVTLPDGPPAETRFLLTATAMRFIKFSDLALDPR